MKHANQRGYVLTAILALVLVASLVYVGRRFANATPRVEQDSIDQHRNSSFVTLEQARDALIIYTLTKTKNTPGSLLCADYDNNGSSDGLCTSKTAPTPARFPYKTLGFAAPLLDDAGECIWYALSPSYRISLDTADRDATDISQLPINPDNFGSLTYAGKQVVAVLMAPGPALEGQHRIEAASGCSSGAPTDFLDPFLTTNNASPVNATFADAKGPTAFSATKNQCMLASTISDPSDRGALCNNDVVLPITRDDIMRPLIRMVLQQLTSSHEATLRDLIQSQGSGKLSQLRAATLTSGVYQFDKQLFDVDNGCTPPDNNYKTTASWLCKNNWYDYIDADATSNTLSITLDVASGGHYACVARLEPADGIWCGATGLVK